MKKAVIAISRAYGSGGTIVGRKLAAELGIPMFDKKIIELAAEKSGLSQDYIDRMEAHASSSFLFNLASASYPTPGLTAQYDIPITFSAFSAQSAVIRELAEKNSCVIIGRCSDYILKDDPNCIKVFLYAEREDRISHVMNEFGLERKQAEAKLNKMDKGRANYYRNFTGESWGSVYSHDLSINTTRTGRDGAVEVIKSYLTQCGIL
ncbi:MAG: AAA family ATPase [Oscillospiraceae bacterium]